MGSDAGINNDSVFRQHLNGPSSVAIDDLFMRFRSGKSEAEYSISDQPYFDSAEEGDETDHEPASSLDRSNLLLGADRSTTSLSTSIASTSTYESAWSADSQPLRRYPSRGGPSKKLKKRRSPPSIRSSFISPTVPQSSGLCFSSAFAFPSQLHREESSMDGEYSVNVNRDRARMASSAESEAESIQPLAGTSWKRLSQSVKEQWIRKAPSISPEIKSLSTQQERRENQLDGKSKKARRPLSFTAMFSRSTQPSDGPRISTTSLVEPAAVRPDTASSTSSATHSMASSFSRVRQRPRSVLHRATLSGGDVPTSKHLLGTMLGDSYGTEETNLGQAGTSSPPVTTMKTPSQPVFVNMTSSLLQSSSLTHTSPQRLHASPIRIAEERPESRLSALSETPTVRRRSTHAVAGWMPWKSQQTLSNSAFRNGAAWPQSLKRQPSLSKTPSIHARPKSDAVITAAPMHCLPLPSAARPKHFSAIQPRPVNGYFASSSNSYITASNGTSPGSRSARSESSVHVARRVSLSDLKIPPRISIAQAKIGEDLRRVREFKRGVEGESHSSVMQSSRTWLMAKCKQN